MSDRGTFCCLKHNHTNAIEEIECSATFQLDQAEAEIERLTKGWEGLEYEASAQIASLAAAVNTMHKEAIEQEKHIAKLEKVLEYAKHLLAGGGEEAVHHLKKAIAALEEEK